MRRCDKDGNGKISYMEFFSAQKDKSISDDKQKKLIQKLASFFKLGKKDQEKVIKEHKENVDKIKHEYEEQIQQLKKEAEEKLAQQQQQQQQPEGGNNEAGAHEVVEQLRQENEKLQQELSILRSELESKNTDNDQKEELIAKFRQQANEAAAFQDTATKLQVENDGIFENKHTGKPTN